MSNLPTEARERHDIDMQTESRGHDEDESQEDADNDAEPTLPDMMLMRESSARLISSNFESSEQETTLSTKRREIQAIIRDSSLTDLERRLKIQNLMDGRVSGAGTIGNCIGGMRLDGSSGNAAGDDSRDESASCPHYERNCKIVAPCCGKIFGCRVCHDEASGHGPMDRFAIKEIICEECKTRQKPSNKCIKCEIQFGEYHCNICNLWMALDKKPFHCDHCGFCRVGGREGFRHCVDCSMCISVTVFESHNCMKDKYKNNCPVCREDMFSSRQSPQDLPCGHAIHAHCFRKLASFDYRCPICKKTVVSLTSMAAAWSARARDIRMQPMPQDLSRIVNIICNDCENKSENRNWHFLGVQCPCCNSFNTVVEEVVSSGADSEQLPNASPPT